MNKYLNLIVQLIEELSSLVVQLFSFPVMFIARLLELIFFDLRYILFYYLCYKSVYFLIIKQFTKFSNKHLLDCLASYRKQEAELPKHYQYVQFLLCRNELLRRTKRLENNLKWKKK